MKLKSVHEVLLLYVCVKSVYSVRVCVCICVHKTRWRKISLLVHHYIRHWRKISLLVNVITVIPLLQIAYLIPKYYILLVYIIVYRTVLLDCDWLITPVKQCNYSVIAYHAITFSLLVFTSVCFTWVSNDNISTSLNELLTM